jgi:hypothetical protein
MPYVTLPGGIRAHVKMARPPRRSCSAEGCTRWATKLCDFAVGPKRTCSKPICDQHAQSVGPDLDHCPVHAGRQSGLFTALVSQQNPKEGP